MVVVLVFPCDDEVSEGLQRHRPLAERRQRRLGLLHYPIRLAQAHKCIHTCHNIVVCQSTSKHMYVADINIV